MYRNVLPGPVRKSLLAGLATLPALTVLTSLAGPASAQEDSVTRGQAIWKEKAGCQECHGWAGDGKGGFHHEGRALSLRVTELTRDQILHDNTMWAARDADAAFRSLRVHGQTLLRHDRG